MSTEVDTTGTARPVHVLLLVKGLGLGGAEKLIVEQVVKGAGDPRVRYSVAYVRPDKDHFVADLRAAGVETVCLGGSRSPWPLRLAKELRRLRPDVVHSHSPLPAAAARLLVRGRLVPVRAHVYTEHNRWQAYNPATRALNAATMALDHHGWAVSAEARGSVRPGFLRDRVEVLHHGIDVEGTRRRAAEQAAALAGDVKHEGPTFLHIANRRPEKAHDHLLAAFARASQGRDGLRLWLVGQYLDDEFARMLAACPARDAITVFGYRDDALGLLQLADALVLSSDHEGLPVAVMEALALRRPVVATAVGGIPEAVTHEVEGLLVPPRDVEALAAAMVRLADDRDLRERLGESARRRSSDFDVSRALSVQRDVYTLRVDRG